MPAHASAAAKPGFRLAGWMVLLILLGFFGSVFAVNGVMVYYALGTFSGTVTNTPYEAGLEYTHEIDAAAAQAQRGWKVDVHTARTADNGLEITATLADKDGSQVNDVAVTATLMHPVYGLHDLVAVLSPAGDGRFEGTVSGVLPGRWKMQLVAARNGQQVFRSDNQLPDLQ